MLTRPHMSRPMPRPQPPRPRPAICGLRPRPRRKIIYTQCPRDRDDKLLCDISCFVNEYLILDYSLLKLDTSVPIRNSKQRLARSSVQCRPKLSKTFSMPQFTRPRPRPPRPRPRPRPRHNITARIQTNLLYGTSSDAVVWNSGVPAAGGVAG